MTDSLHPHDTNAEPLHFHEPTAIEVRGARVHNLKNNDGGEGLDLPSAG
ncbi:MAG: hypothetical protein HFJ71_09340, partial [Eggerthellaceae bacterium]|nr:hypothetical protein [Eggerthellaceae bacterium]